MAQKGFYFDQISCIGCKVCQVACKDKNDLKVGTLYRRVYDLEFGKYPNPRKAHLAISCNHCENPKCVENCPTGALQKRSEDGIVTHDRDTCIGCRLCTWSCPYEAMQYKEEEGKVGKCDGCLDLINQGENPVCVDACVMRCLFFDDIEKLRGQYGDNADTKGLPNSGITSPNITITAKIL